jgi:hypothetical protein
VDERDKQARRLAELDPSQAASPLIYFCRLIAQAAERLFLTVIRAGAPIKSGDIDGSYCDNNQKSRPAPWWAEKGSEEYTLRAGPRSRDV